MEYKESFEWQAGEIHCYFPEWADRPAWAGTPNESDHNSYMAGGYAEEFGYRADGDCAAALPALGSDPDQSLEWLVQMGGLHPGYPECPRPLDRDGSGNASTRRGAFVSVLARAASGNVGQASFKTEVRFTAVPVTQRHRSPTAYQGRSLASWWRDLRIRRRGLSRML